MSQAALKTAPESVTATLTVGIPKLRATPSGTSEVRPKRVASWLAELPAGDPQDAGQQISNALFNQNRIALEDSNRLRVMEAYRVPVAAIIETLQSGYETAPVPHSKTRRENVRFVNRLLTEMAHGYKVVAVNLALRGKIKQDRDELVLSIQRSLYQLGQLLLNGYCTYQPAAVGVWRDVHRLYQYAEVHGLTDDMVEQSGAGLVDDQTSIGQTYQHLLLLAAGDPYCLLSGEAKRIYEILKSVHGSPQITRTVTFADPVGQFLISFASDAPPVALGKVNNVKPEEHLRVLSALDAIRDLHSMMKKGERAARSGNESDSGNVELIRRVGRMWAGNMARRQSNRATHQYELPVCSGISATHFFCTSAHDIEQTRQKQSVSDTAPPIAKEVYVDLSSAPGDDGLLRPGNAGAAAAQDDEPTFGSGLENQTLHRLQLCHAMDESAGGARVRIYAGSSVRVTVGDIMGMQYADSANWKVAVVRWLRAYDEDFVDVGVKFLAPEVQAVTVRPIPRTGEVKPFMHALKLPRNDALNTPESIVLPRGLYGPGDRLELKDIAGSSETLVPMHVVDRTSSFEQIVVAPATS